MQVKFKVRRSTWRTLAQDALPPYADNVVGQTEGVTAYTPIQNEVLALKAKSEALAALLAAIRMGSHATVAQKNQAKLELYTTLEAVARGLEGNATDGLYIINAGMELVKSRSVHMGDLLPVEGFTIATNGIPNQMQLRFTCPPTQRRQVETFAVEHTIDDGQNWQNGLYRNAMRILATDLPSRMEIRFRVRCIGTHGRKSPWTESNSAFVL